MRKILIVEDDRGLTGELAIFLKNNGYGAEVINDFTDTEAVVGEMAGSGCDLVLLDIGLPGCDGQFLLKSLREKSDIPVIMITSRDNELDELTSMNFGADDYVTKPFNTRILLAKIEAVLRRTCGSVNVLAGDTFTLNVSESAVEGDSGTRLELTKNEMRILYYLLKNKGRIVPREELMGYIWDSDEFVDDNTLTVNVTRVREKLEKIGAAGAIVTRRGQGYMIPNDTNSSDIRSE